MKRFVALWVLASALFGFTGCQPRAEPAASSAVVAEEPAPRDARDLGVLQATDGSASHLPVNRYKFSFEGGSHYLTDTATGQVWNLSRGAWKPLPPLQAE